MSKWIARMAMSVLVGLVTVLGATLVPTAAGASATTGIVNAKWAGYAASGTSFAAVSGSWTVPAAACGAADPRTTLVWIGLDGASTASSTVEQAGTGIVCAANGTAVHFAWTEFYPNLASTLSTTQYPVQPGDVMTATITAGSGTFDVTMSDNRSGATLWSYTTTIASPGASFSTAEWIVEAPAPSAGGTDLPILPVDTTFTAMSVTTSAGSTSGLTGNLFSWRAISLVQGSSTETPTPLTADGKSFGVSAGPQSPTDAATVATTLTGTSAQSKALTSLTRQIRRPSYGWVSYRSTMGKPS